MSEYFVHESSYIDDDVKIGKGTKIWHFCHIQKGAEIGENCSFGQNVNVSNHVKIGNGVKVQNNVSIYEGVELEDYVFCGPSMVFTNDLTPRAKYPKGNAGYKKTLLIYEGVELEDYVFCGPSMVFTNDLTPRAKYPKGNAGYKKTLLKEGATVGANATIVCGHTIGKWAMIAAGAVVTKDVPDYALMAGVPARQIGWVCECGEVLSTKLECKVCKRSYQEHNIGLKEK